MPIHDSFIAELQQEAAGTRKLLERVPNNFNFKPHEKSMPLGYLARHVAELVGWISYTVNSNELDFAKTPYVPREVTSTQELVDELDGNVKQAIDDLRKTDDAAMMQNWSLRNGENIFFTLPKVVVLRSVVFNHLYHHRGQLTVYLRLLDVPLPGLYGPTADEPM